MKYDMNLRCLHTSRILSIVHFVFFIRACLADPQGASVQNQAELGNIKHTQQPPTYPQEQYAQQQHQPYPAQ